MTSSSTALQELFRGVMANFAASVTVVTSYADGRHHGLTVSAFTSVSLEPPLVLICIDHRSHSIEALRTAGGFTVNMLREGADAAALMFASKDPDKFGGQATAPPEYGGAGLRLPEISYACLECRTVEFIEAGDHTVFIGRVEGAVRSAAARPLLYWNRSFPRLLPG